MRLCTANRPSWASGAERLCRPGDIALLAPTGAELWRYEEALERRGIPRRHRLARVYSAGRKALDLIRSSAFSQTGGTRWRSARYCPAPRSVSPKRSSLISPRRFRVWRESPAGFSPSISAPIPPPSASARARDPREAARRRQARTGKLLAADGCGSRGCAGFVRSCGQVADAAEGSDRTHPTGSLSLLRRRCAAQDRR